jgi:serine/threonine-protein phosphatase 2A regulatory subunit B'
MLSDQKNVT